MARREHHEFFASRVEEWIGGNNERTSLLLDQTCEGCVERGFGDGMHRLYLQPELACRRLQVLGNGLGVRITWVRKYANHHGLGHKLMQKLQLLRLDCNGKQADAGGISARTVETGDQAKLDRVAGENEDNRYRRSRRFCCQCRCRPPGRSDDCYVTRNQIGSECRKTVKLALGPTVFDNGVLALDIASFLQPL